MFRLRASAFDDFVAIELVTFSDVWMRYDLKGNAQPTVYDANAPRLSAALQYVPMSSGHGVGYLWASDAEWAASFERRDDAGEEGYKTGLLWLDRLHSAYAPGLSPSRALTELAGSSGADRPGSMDLASLRELESED
ncbi:hypothetical protein [Streptomyces sp. NPDC002994]|uniref:hypothetical protein n=1 Tax=Streptomyces sp. NPDC002994 TaxID=3154441 RepID=UPI0033A20AA0